MFRRDLGIGSLTLHIREKTDKKDAEKTVQRYASRGFDNRKIFIMTLLGSAVIGSVIYGAVTFQTPYGCDQNGVAAGPDLDWQILARPCIYIYFTGIVGGSVFVIFLIPVTEEKKSNPP